MNLGGDRAELRTIAVITADLNVARNSEIQGLCSNTVVALQQKNELAKTLF